MFIIFNGDTISLIVTATQAAIQPLLPLIALILSIVIAFYVLRQIIFNLKLAK